MAFQLLNILLTDCRTEPVEVLSKFESFFLQTAFDGLPEKIGAGTLTTFYTERLLNHLHYEI